MEPDEVFTGNKPYPYQRIPKKFLKELDNVPSN